jgi:hypothetical protein
MIVDVALMLEADEADRPVVFITGAGPPYGEQTVGI